MIRKALFFFFNFCLLALLFACSDCSATVPLSDQFSEINETNFETNPFFIENPYVDYCTAKGILIEITNEQDFQDVAFLPLEPLSCDSSKYHKFLAIFNLRKTLIKGLLERNITPAQYASRTILFHSLKIYQ